MRFSQKLLNVRILRIHYNLESSYPLHSGFHRSHPYMNTNSCLLRHCTALHSCMANWHTHWCLQKCVPIQINTLRSQHSGLHFVEDIFKLIFIYMKIVAFGSNFTEIYPNGPTNNNSLLVPKMAWRRIGVKPFSEPIMASFTDANMHQSAPAIKRYI